MKKIHKTNPISIQKVQYTQKSKTSLFQLLPTILKLLPNLKLDKILNFKGLKEQNNNNIKANYIKQNTNIKSENNIKYAKSYIENHNKKVEEIKKKNGIPL